jgi:hypothetical protein
MQATQNVELHSYNVRYSLPFTKFWAKVFETAAAAEEVTAWATCPFNAF